MDYYESVLDVIGNTPLIKLGRLAAGSKALVLAKLESANPGGSVKDRIGLELARDALATGKIKAGGTIIEGTSGNTGVGLAIACNTMGLKTIFTMPDKMSQEKIDLLKAYGAEVIITPTAVAPDDPRSYYSVAQKLSEEIPNSYYPNQYMNPVNPQTHYKSTGPEIWKQTEGKITHFVAGLGTGGTVSGIGKYLKEQNPAIKIIGADPIGSLYYDYFQRGIITESKTYLVEGIGEDILPKTMDFSILDDVIQVTDRDSFTMTRNLLKQEGLFCGGSSGTAVWAAQKLANDLTEDDVVVVLLPDSGSRYLSKIYNDQWMRENQMLESRLDLTAEKIASQKANGAPMEFISVKPDTNVSKAVTLMKEYGISQIPVAEGETIIGSLRDAHLVEVFVANPDARDGIVREVMSEPFPEVARDTSVDELHRLLTRDNSAVLMKRRDGSFDVITRHDVMSAII